MAFLSGYEYWVWNCFWFLGSRPTSDQVINRCSGGILPLLTARPAIMFPAIHHHSSPARSVLVTMFTTQTSFSSRLVMHTLL